MRFSDILTTAPYSAVGWIPKPSPEVSFHIFLQCESTISCVIDEYNDMTFIHSVGACFRYLSITIITAALNPNVNTASSKY